MNPEFRKTIEKIKALNKEPLPRVRFSSDIIDKFPDYSDRLYHFEAMTIFLECHPFFPFNDEFSFGEILDYRRALAYEVIIRLLGHCRSFIANTNIYNHIGTAVALRCMLELNAFLIYLKDHNYKDNVIFLEKLLHGQIFSSGEWYEYEQVWKEKYNEPLTDEFKRFLKSFLKTPHVGEYLKSAKANDQVFGYVYSIYSNFIHPTFGKPRNQFIEDIGQKPDGLAVGFEKSSYYLLAQKEPSPPNSLKRDISAAGFCLELIWPEIMNLDPFYDPEVGILKLLSEASSTKKMGGD